GAARRWPRRGRDHPRRPTGTRPSGRGLGRYGGRGDRPTHPARHELRPESDARACRRGAAAPGAVPQADSGGRGPGGVAHQCALRRAAAPRVRGAGAATAAMKWVALLGVLAVWRLAPLQGGEWTATPATPTVGDTVWLEREIVVPAGWRIRAGKLDATEQAEPLAEPAVRRTRDGWLVRYPIVAWTPGTHVLTLPPVWRLGPDGRADSVPGGVARFLVGSVIPDTVRGPQPRGALAPVRGARRSALPVAAALLVAGAILAAGLRWRRRAPLTVPPPPPVPLEHEVPDARWLAAGEPKAVAARATYRLRVALARAIPAAGHPHERRAPGGGRERAPVGCPAPRHAAQPVPRRLDRRGRGAARRVGPCPGPERGDLDRARDRPLEQHAVGRLRPRQSHRRRQADRDRLRPGAEIGPHRAGGVRGAGAHPGPDHHRLCRARASAARPAHRHARGRHCDRHRDRHRGVPVATRPRQEQGHRAAHRRREQPGHGGPAHRRAGGRHVRDQDLRDRGGDARGGPGADGAGARRAALPDDAGGDR